MSDDPSMTSSTGTGSTGTGSTGTGSGTSSGPMPASAAPFAAATAMVDGMLKLQLQATEAMVAAFGGGFAPVALAGDQGVPPAWTAMTEQFASLVGPFAAAGSAALSPVVGPQLLGGLTGVGVTGAGLTGAEAPWRSLVESWYRALPLPDEQARERLLADGLALWEVVLQQLGAPGSDDRADLPRKDRRFADPRWREQPAFAVIHQAYLLLADQLTVLADQAEGLDPEQRQRFHFTLRTMIEALSPANFPLTNPVVLDRLVETRGESLMTGLRHLLADTSRGQLTQSAPGAFEVGRNLATTPGKVIHETPLYQLIQYSPVTERVLSAPLVIFPPWINRFYILDLTPPKSFVRWAVEQGLTVLMVSWKSADASLADVAWDDYIRAQIEAIDVARSRFKVPAVHTIGYCVAGTTLAATLAVLARRGEADKVASATFFTAQVDFELAGELRTFIDDTQLALIAGLARDGCIDGRYLASTFNLLRGRDLIWNYVVSNYLLGEDYPAFDLLHWNGDSANVPAGWHQSYLRDLYRDNLLVEPDRLEADGTPIDLRRITTPCFIQAGREDHIAPPQSVWRLTQHLAGPWTFTLAGSGHIAGVVNPPAAGKYQYWTNPGVTESFEAFVETAQEHPGSWWPAWIEWVRALGPDEVAANGRRAPGGRGDRVIEDAPGRYVLQH